MNKKLDFVYEEQGSGPAVILLHGLGGTSNTFSPQVRLLSDRYRLIRPDLPGMGRSGAASPRDIEFLADAMLELQDSLGLRTATWIGHSLGTLICQHAAIKHPDRVSSLVLMGAFHEAPQGARSALRERGGMIRTQGMESFVDAYLGIALAQATLKDNPAAVAFLRESMMRQLPAGYAAYCDFLSDYSGADLSLIQCPTLLITGNEDKVGSPAIVQTMASKLKGASVEIINECGHWHSIEHPALVGKMITAHLEKFATQ